MSEVKRKAPYRIYVVSGATGTSAQGILDRALSQFPGASVTVETATNVRSAADLERVVREAAGRRATIVHTLVNAEMRQALISLARDHNVVAIDLIGRLVERLTTELGQEPLEQPGLYHQLHIEDFRRSEAINFTVAHDDSQRIHELDQADIVLIGVSRVSKTPLSVFLSLQGWKVANVPLILNQDPPALLFEIPSSRVVGLTVDPSRLQELRSRRSAVLGLRGRSDYAAMEQLSQELEWARLIFRRGRFASVDVTSRSIEEMAQAVTDLVRRRASG